MQYFFHVLSIHYIGILSKNLCTCTFLRKVIIYKYSLMSSTIICMRVNVMYEGLQHIHRENESISGSGRLQKNKTEHTETSKLFLYHYYIIHIYQVHILSLYTVNVSLYFRESLLKSSTLSIKGTILSTDTYLLFKNFCFKILIYQNIVYLLI